MRIDMPRSSVEREIAVEDIIEELHLARRRTGMRRDRCGGRVKR
jgi:hypothetical protein